MGQPSAAAAKLDALKWRCIGPPRGGRVVAVAGDPEDRSVFYFGACAGGVWKTIDGGIYWRCVSDGFLGSAAIGALALARSDPNVIYAGTGETEIRLDVSYGDGIDHVGVRGRHGERTDRGGAEKAVAHAAPIDPAINRLPHASGAGAKIEYTTVFGVAGNGDDAAAPRRPDAAPFERIEFRCRAGELCHKK